MQNIMVEATDYFTLGHEITVVLDEEQRETPNICAATIKNTLKKQIKNKLYTCLMQKTREKSFMAW